MRLTDFRHRYDTLRLAAKTYRALELVLVYGLTWQKAASMAGVHQSTICRALQRHPPEPPPALRLVPPPPGAALPAPPPIDPKDYL